MPWYELYVLNDFLGYAHVPILTFLPFEGIHWVSFGHFCSFNSWAHRGTNKIGFLCFLVGDYKPSNLFKIVNQQSQRLERKIKNVQNLDQQLVVV